MDPRLPVNERVESLLSVMTPEDKMELIREGWGIPGIPHLYVPPITKVEAVHGFHMVAEQQYFHRRWLWGRPGTRI